MIPVPCLLYPTLGTVFSSSPRALLIALMALSAATKSAALGSCYPSSFMLTNNSSPNIVMGRINGTGQTLVSVTRTFAPIVSGSAFAFSLSLHHRYAVYLAFALCSGMFAAAHLLTRSLPAYLDSEFDPEMAAAASAARCGRRRAGGAQGTAYELLV